MDEITIASKQFRMMEGVKTNEDIDKIGYELIIVETWEIIILPFLLLSMFGILQNQIIKKPF